MGSAIGGSLVMAIGIAITPLAISAAVLLLTTSHARINGPAFVLGWLIGLGVVGALALLVLGPEHANRSGATAGWVNWLKVVIGLLFLGIALYELQHRSIPRRSLTSGRWVEKLESVRPPAALGIGTVLAGARPKDLLLIIVGAAAIAQAGLSPQKQSIAYAVFAGVATVGVAVPVAVYFAMGEKAPSTLASMQQWIDRKATVVTIVVSALIAADLIGMGVGGLA